jgi:hypothetical protein
MNNIQSSVDPDAVVLTSSINPDVGQLSMTDEFQYTSTVEFDDHMELDLGFFSLSGDMGNTGGEFDDLVLPTSHFRNTSNDQMPQE